MAPPFARELARARTAGRWTSIACLLLGLLVLTPRCAGFHEESNCERTFTTRCIDNRVETCNTDGGDLPWRWQLVEACGERTCRGGLPLREEAHCAAVVGSDPRCPSSGAVAGDACYGDRLVKCHDGFVTYDYDCATAVPSTVLFCVLEGGAASCTSRRPN